ncbi:MAG: DUF421 domain-containing protein [Pseudomonadota bacterium]
MYNKIIYSVILALAGYVTTVALMRLIRRKLISQMTFSDFVIGVAMGSIVANLIMGPVDKTIAAAAALFSLTGLAVITDLIQLRSLRFEKLVNSEPVTVIDSGSIVEDNMRKLHLTVSELTAKLREKNMFSLADVEFAIMETDGQLSVLAKPDKAPLTPSHMNIKAESPGLMRDVIIDGQVMEENLKGAGLDKRWLHAQLSTGGIADPSMVFYAGVDNSKKIYISARKAVTKETHGKYGIE